MNIRTILSTTALAAVLGASSSALAANQCGGDIQFAKGKSSADVKGQVAGYDFCEYTFYAKKGQQLTVSMNKSDLPQASLYEPVEQPLADNQAFTLPKNGKYTLRVMMTRNDARKYNKAQPFTMHFAINGAASAQDTQQANAAASGFAGQYEGVLPCHTCNGVDTFLSLYDDGTYTLSERYFDKENEASFAAQGHWMAQGQAIVLEPEHDAPSQYFFAHGHDLYAVSREQAGAANPKLSEQYRLKHQ